MKFGIDRLLTEPDLKKQLEGRRVALVAHPASVTADLTHSLDALVAAGINVTSAFGPQHGLKGDKQDNMVETADETDPRYGIPVFSLYGEVRRDRGRVCDQRHPLALEFFPQFRLCKQAVDAEFHEPRGAGSVAVKQAGSWKSGFSAGCASAQ